jgi:GT2 family glycosyltransferase
MSPAPEPRLEPRADPNSAPRVSVIISTFNRASALAETLEQFNRQTLPTAEYEVIVTDDGSSDDTQEVLANADTRYELRAIHFERNRGVSAGRNAAIRASRGDRLILVSDDVLVPEDFLAAHLEAGERWPDDWIVGRFEQLPDLAEAPFARYLEAKEAEWEALRKGEQLEDGVWRLSVPTARNLGLPRAHLEKIGLFDERFATTCEDQDLAHRAERSGIGFIWVDSIRCVHNDQAADLERSGSFYERGSADTVRLCDKYPELHGSAEAVYVNGPIRRDDGIRLTAKKVVKQALARKLPLRALHAFAHATERLGAPDGFLARIYSSIIGLHILRGWRRGLAEVPADSPIRNPAALRR